MGATVAKQTSYQLDFYSPDEIAAQELPTAVLDETTSNEYGESVLLTEPSKELASYSPTRLQSLSSSRAKNAEGGIDLQNPSGSVWQDQGASGK